MSKHNPWSELASRERKERETVDREKRDRDGHPSVNIHPPVDMIRPRGE